MLHEGLSCSGSSVAPWARPAGGAHLAAGDRSRPGPGRRGGSRRRSSRCRRRRCPGRSRIWARGRRRRGAGTRSRFWPGSAKAARSAPLSVRVTGILAISAAPCPVEEAARDARRSPLCRYQSLARASVGRRAAPRPRRLAARASLVVGSSTWPSSTRSTAAERSGPRPHGTEGDAHAAQPCALARGEDGDREDRDALGPDAADLGEAERCRGAGAVSRCAATRPGGTGVRPRSRSSTGRWPPDRCRRPCRTRAPKRQERGGEVAVRDARRRGCRRWCPCCAAAARRSRGRPRAGSRAAARPSTCAIVTPAPSADRHRSVARMARSAGSVVRTSRGAAVPALTARITTVPPPRYAALSPPWPIARAASSSVA